MTHLQWTPDNSKLALSRTEIDFPWISVIFTGLIIFYIILPSITQSNHVCQYTISLNKQYTVFFTLLYFRSCIFHITLSCFKGGGRSHCVKVRVLARLSCRFRYMLPATHVTSYKRGGGGWGHGHPWTPLGYAPV